NLTVSNLEIGDYLVDFYDNNIKIVDIKFIDTDSVKTYNFTVEDNYNYYANNILVHNKTEPQTQVNYCIVQADPLGGG
ncbi:MAG: Hint domain-containing protein, partial [Methanobacterium sp.]